MAVDFGTDVDVSTDLPLRRQLVSGKANLGRALVRRLMTPRGALAIVGEDPNYGLDVRQLLNEQMTPTAKATWQSKIARECEKDERVLGCVASIQFNAGASTATITLTIATADTSAPFSLVVAVSALTVQLLEAA